MQGERRLDLHGARGFERRPPFQLERFEYAPAAFVLRLSVRVALVRPPAAPALLIEHAAREHRYSPLVWSTQLLRPIEPEQRLWRAAFVVPSEIATGTTSFFALELADTPSLPLPRPVVPVPEDDEPTAAHARRVRPALKRGALALTLAGLGVPLMAPLAATADAPANAESVAVEAHQPDEAPAAEGNAPSTQNTEVANGDGPPSAVSESVPPAEPPPPPAESPSRAGASEGVPRTGGGEAGERAGETPTASPAQGAPEAAGAGHGHVAPQTHASTTTATVPAQVRTGTQAPAASTHVRAGGGHPAAASGDRHSRHAAAKPATTSPVPAALAEPPEILSWVLPPGVEDLPPSYLLPIYHEAARRYHVPWTILAAINRIETDFGRNLSVSSAGALGWMQFMPATWQEWAVDADHDGVADPYSPRDAIFTAARYLQASGADRDLPAAIYAYNHAQWYVAAVMLAARSIAHEPVGAPLNRGYSLPLDRRYMNPLGRTDDGVDIENAPDGALVYSMTPGIVTTVASDPGGFGPNYPVIEATSGPLAGQHVYYGHVAAALVTPGEHVRAGEPIAIMGHAGDAASLGHGHIEIGFSDAGGVPLSQHGATPATPAGEVMRSFLIELSSAFGLPSS